MVRKGKRRDTSLERLTLRGINVFEVKRKGDIR
jgi:hypothetical protein